MNSSNKKEAYIIENLRDTFGSLNVIYLMCEASIWKEANQKMKLKSFNYDLLLGDNLLSCIFVCFNFRFLLLTGSISLSKVPFYCITIQYLRILYKIRV